MIETIDVRRAGPADLDLLAALQLACFDQPWVEQQWDRDSFAQALAAPGGFGLVAGRPADGTVIGFAIVRVAADEAELLSIAVLPDLRGRGHGRRLLQAAAAEARAGGAVRVFLEVAETNPVAQRLYASAGFRPVGRRRGYYPGLDGRVDALVLRLDLPQLF